MLERVLPVLSRLVSFPEPACYLANFDFLAFKSCCENSGNEYLVKQAKGLIPYNNCDLKMIPLFVPFR